MPLTTESTDPAPRAGVTETVRLPGKANMNLVMGTASDEHKHVYDVVRVANERAAKGVRAGMTGRDADAISLY